MTNGISPNKASTPNPHSHHVLEIRLNIKRANRTKHQKKYLKPIAFILMTLPNWLVVIKIIGGEFKINSYLIVLSLQTKFQLR